MEMNEYAKENEGGEKDKTMKMRRQEIKANKTSGREDKDGRQSERWR